MKVSYSLNNVRLPAITSNVVSTFHRSEEITLPPNSNNVLVKIELLKSFSWKLIHQDENLGVSTECKKCYKTWGTIFKPRWDYLFC